MFIMSPASAIAYFPSLTIVTNVLRFITSASPQCPLPTPASIRSSYWATKPSTSFSKPSISLLVHLSASHSTVPLCPQTTRHHPSGHDSFVFRFTGVCPGQNHCSNAGLGARGKQPSISRTLGQSGLAVSRNQP